MRHLSQVEITQNISASVSHLSDMISDISIIAGTILFYLAVIWLMVNVVRYYFFGHKGKTKVRFKLPLSIFGCSVVLSVLPLFFH